MKIRYPKPSNEIAQITVVIPCHNYGRFLPQVVSSILEQERVQARVIIVDDASTDESADIAQQLSAADPRVDVVFHAENQGHIRTYNDGLQRVVTEYAALLSADDLLVPGALARATDLMAHWPRVGMVYGRPIAFSDSEKTPKIPAGRGSSWTLWRGREWIGWAARRGRCFILSPEVVVRTAAMNDIGLYNSDLPHSGDLEYWLRIAAHWDVGRINGFAQALYRLHSTNMHLVSYNTLTIDLKHRLDAFMVLKSPKGPPDTNFGNRAFRRAAKAIAREALISALRELDSDGCRDTAIRLATIACEADREVQKSRRFTKYQRRLRRSESGKSPGILQRVEEFFRCQVNKFRWRIWDAVGIS